MAVKNFRQILKEKMTENAAESKPTPGLPPFHLEFRMPKFEFAQSNLNNAYPRPPRKVPPPSPRRPTKEDKVIEAGRLLEAEVVALQALGIKADGRLSYNSVKSTYRRLMHRLHPDHHPSDLSALEKRRMTEEFQTVHEASLLIDQAFRRLAG